MLAEELQGQLAEGAGRLGAISGTGAVGPLMGSVLKGKISDLYYSCGSFRSKGLRGVSPIFGVFWVAGHRVVGSG